MQFARILLLGFVSLFIGSVFAQNLAFTTLTTDVTTCGNAEVFGVIYQNQSVDTLKNVRVAVVLPPGIRYVASSIAGSGFSEFNISNLDSAIFSAANLPPLQADTFLILIEAGCGAADSSAVTNGVYVFSNLGTDFFASSPYSILRPAISIQSITPSSFTGPLGSSFQRCVTLINGGYGTLSELTVVIESSAASLIQSNFTLTANGSPLTPVVSGDSMILTFGPTHFAAIGNGDGVLDQNETMSFCFQVLVDDCIDLATAISAYWGCGGDICDVQTSSANVIVPALVPNVVAQDYFIENRCYGGGTPSIIKIVLTNNGTGPARDLIIDLWQGEPTGPSNGYISRLDSSTMLLKSSTGTVTAVSPFQVELGSNGGLYACLGPNALRRVKVRIPLMQPGQQDTLVVEQYSCCKDWCASGPSVMSRTHYQIDYNDQCFTSSYTIPANIVTSWNFGRVLSFTNAGLFDIPLGDTAAYEIEHSSFRFYNFSPGGYAWVDIIVPPGLTAPTAPGCIFFEDIQGDLWNPYSVITSGDTVRAFFSLAQPAGFSLEKCLLKFKLTNDCSGGPCSGGPKNIQYSVHQIADTTCGCKLTIGCHDFDVNSHCGICPATCVDKGLIFLGFESLRKNYGLPDNDNNGLPDAVGTIDMNAVRTRHLMLRDTLFTQFLGVVDTTAANPSWAEGFASSTITRGTSLTPTSYTVRIVDMSTGMTYNCNLPAPTTTTSGSTRTFRYNFNVSSLAACLPVGFVYEVNDTIEVTAEYIVSNNIGSVVEAQNITNQFALQTAGGALVASCDNYSGGFVLVGYYYTSSGPDEFSASGCNNVTVTENYYLSIGNCCSNYNGGNIFNYEFRHWGIPSVGRYIVPAGYSFVSATLRHYYTSGTQVSTSSLLPITPVAINGDTIVFDIAAQFVSNGGPLVLGDDGYVGTVNVVLEPSCEVLSDIMQPVKYLWDFDPIGELTGPGSVNPFSQRSDSISYEGPSISINPLLPTTPGITSVVSWDFTLENNSNTAAAGNTWFALISPSGQIVPTTVTDLTTGLPLTLVNGMYQVGNLPQDSSWAYRIVADYNNCSPDSLRIVSGWDCNAYPATVATYSCTPTESWLYILPQPSELQANFAIEPGSHDICDSFFVDIQVVSSQIAYVQDIMLRIGLPLTGGLTFNSGSAMMQYPVSGAFVPIPDPVIAGNLLTWDVNTLNALIASRDLPGTLLPDSNVFNIRFYLNTNCDMISGDRIRLRIESARGCGDQMTPLILLSTPIQISGAIQPYTTQISGSNSQVSNCPLQETVSFDMVHAGVATTNAGDSIFFNLGPGYSYGGGFVGLVNAPSNTAPNIQSGPGGLRLGWEMPAGLVVGDSVRFTFTIEVGDDVPCGPDIVSIQTVTTQTLFCARTASNCVTATQTGSFSLNLNIARPDLSFTAFNSTLAPIVGGFDYIYSGTMFNNGLPIPPGTPIVIQFYCDSDNSGDYTPLDNPIGSYSTSAGLANGGSANFSGTFFISNASCTNANIIYGLIVPNSAAGFCLCDTTFGNSNVVLPAQWLQVKGEALENANRITWEVNTLVDHAYFELQKLEGSSWKSISDRITDLKTRYTELDLTPATRERYRVLATDQNGDQHASNEVELLRANTLESVQVYPNPATRSVFLKTSQDAEFRIFNAFGQMVLEGKSTANEATAVSLEALAAGVYMIEFKLEGSRKTVRLVVE